jgi:hypothetical protein
LGSSCNILHTSRSPLLYKTANDIEEWPFRSPDLIPQAFFWEFLKGDARITSLLLIEEIKTRAIATSAKNDYDILQNMWQEIEYRFDVSHVGGSAHISTLKSRSTKRFNIKKSYNLST